MKKVKKARIRRHNYDISMRNNTQKSAVLSIKNKLHWLSKNSIIF